MWSCGSIKIQAVTVKSPSKFWIVFEVVWVIEEKFVMEAYLGGKLLGEI